jgi:hypothetical protein
MFPAARIVVTEIEDDDLGISYRGPVGRMLDAGAETYLPPATISSLARQLNLAVTQRPRSPMAPSRSTRWSRPKPLANG